MAVGRRTRRSALAPGRSPGYTIMRGWSDRDRQSDSVRLRTYADLAEQRKSAQCHDAFSPYGSDLIRCYIMPCGDYTDEGRHDVVTRICADFGKSDRTTVLEPPYIWSFLFDTNATRLEALTTAFLDEGDPLVKDPVLSISDYTPTQRRVLLFAIAHLISARDRPYSLNEVRSEPMIQAGASLSENWTDVCLPPNLVIPPDSQTVDDTEPAPSAADIEIPSPDLELDDEEHLIVRTDEDLGPLMALGYEGWARYGHTGAALVEYLEDMLLASAPVRGENSICTFKQPVHTRGPSLQVGRVVEGAEGRRGSPGPVLCPAALEASGLS